MAQVNFRIDDQVKRDADELFDKLGLSLSAAITIFLKQSISRRGFPFPICETSSASVPFGMYYSHASVPPPVAKTQEDSNARKKAAIMDLAGSWKDDRTTEEIIRDVEGARTKGRKVDL